MNFPGSFLVQVLLDSNKFLDGQHPLMRLIVALVLYVAMTFTSLLCFIIVDALIESAHCDQRTFNLGDHGSKSSDGSVGRADTPVWQNDLSLGRFLVNPF